MSLARELGDDDADPDVREILATGSWLSGDDLDDARPRAPVF
jgi:hypothetical protein